jgi:tagatose 6-phosphate kinase
MITTVTLNAAIDKTYYVSNFLLDHVNRVEEMYSEPGGKGNNVAKVLHTLGEVVIASGFAGGFNGKKISQELERLSIKNSFVPVKDESRICLNIIDPLTGESTEILESGPVISEEEWKQMKEKISRLSESSEIISFSGSLAKGLKPNAYAELIEIVNKAGKIAVLDSSGESLMEALSSKPYLIKPNIHELAQLVGKKELSEQEVVDTAKELQKEGIAVVVVSLGKEGLIAAFDNNTFKVTPPKMEIRNSVGSGDALVAGILSGLVQGYSLEKTLILGVACGTANALELKAGIVKRENVELIRKQVNVERI